MISGRSDNGEGNEEDDAKDSWEAGSREAEELVSNGN